MSSPLMIQGPAGYDPILGEMRTNNFSTGSGAAVPGYRMNDSGGMLNQDRYFPIENVTGSTVTLQAGHAYSINATSGGITLNCEVFSASRFGLEGHLQIFTANAGYIHAGANVYLKEALEPNSINNCLVRFHGGSATISVEDHLGGYIVISGGTATGSGSLPYGLASAASSYIAFSDLPELTGVPITMGGVATNGEKHIAGNSYADTILTGGITCTSKTTFANLTMSGVVNSGGTMTLTDVHIPNNATVAVASGVLAVEKVTGDGSESVIDLGGTNVTVSSGTTASVSRCIISNGIGGTGGFLAVSSGATAHLSGCLITGCTASNLGGGVAVRGTAYVTDCVFSDNTGTYGGKDIITLENTAVCYISGTTTDVTAFRGNIRFAGSNSAVNIGGGGGNGTVTLEDNAYLSFNERSFTAGACFFVMSSGATLDLTGNTNATPIAPGGGVTFAPGGATVYPSAGSASAYALGGMTVPKITNTPTVDLAGTHVVVSSGTSASASGCVFSGGNASNGGFATVSSNGVANIENCLITGCSASNMFGGIEVAAGGTAYVTGCTFSENYAQYGGADGGVNGGTMYMSDCVASAIAPFNGKLYFSGSNTVSRATIGGAASATVYVDGYLKTTMLGAVSGTVVISSGASINLTSSIATGGGIVVDGGTCTINGVTVEPTAEGSAYTSIINSGGTLYIDGEPQE